MGFKEAVGKIRVKFVAFLATSFGHACEHAVTAAATTAVALLVSKYATNKALTLADARDAIALFGSGAIFGLRTAAREWLKSDDNPTKRTDEMVEAIVKSDEQAHEG